MNKNVDIQNAGNTKKITKVEFLLGKLWICDNVHCKSFRLLHGRGSEVRDNKYK